MEAFIIRAVLAAVGIAIIAGSLGCFVIWRRMSYFSESISHSALLGAALGLASGLGMHIGLLLVSAVFALLITILQQRKFLSNDAILGIFSHIALSLGIVVLSLVGGANIDYFSLLFGDVLSVTNTDIIWVYLVLIVIISLLYFFWQRLLLLTLNEELARAEGIKQTLYQLLFMLMIALTVSVSVQIVGVLLISSLLIISPAIAKMFACSPSQMLFRSILVSVLAVLLGLGSSVVYDIATGPAIVLVLGIMFVFSQLVGGKSLT